MIKNVVAEFSLPYGCPSTHLTEPPLPPCPIQGVYTVGLLMFVVYSAHFSLWPVLYPMVFEFSCLLYLTGLKIYYEVSLV